eukprot:TRINITY_DN28635_c0_g1_i1.p1 TRINITY_DN28635_c0_g1~~TRINITY_DN28635_c0_g1_i1.p1  ORF type:complete len:1099 (+),score=261.80 TRINITY_DN28635_c0_g1_i1:107-3403(+)
MSASQSSPNLLSPARQSSWTVPDRDMQQAMAADKLLAKTFSAHNLTHGHPSGGSMVAGGGSLLSVAEFCSQPQLSSFSSSAASPSSHSRHLRLHNAAENGEWQMVMDLLRENSTDVDRKGKNGRTALHYAVASQSLECVVVLLIAGWDPTAADDGGKTPVHHAVATADSGSDAEATRTSKRNIRCAILLALLIFGGNPEAVKKKGVKEPSLAFLLHSWDTVRDVIVVGRPCEGREVDFLRNFAAISLALSSLKRSEDGSQEAEESISCLGGACTLLCMIVERHVQCLVSSTGDDRHEADGTYCFEDSMGGWPTYQQVDGEYTAAYCPIKRRWEVKKRYGDSDLELSGDSVSSKEGQEVRFVAADIDGFIIQGLPQDFNTYSESSVLPQVNADADSSDDAPFIGLLNPRSGNKKGAVFLEPCRRFPVYRRRMFDIVRSVTDDVTKAAFRHQLQCLRLQAKRRRCRARVIVGGGDGTASFAVWVILRAARHLRWTDEELVESFPALVQMPLGTGNDLAGVLGWSREVLKNEEAKKWLKNAVCRHRPVREFDVWGMTIDGKVCMFAGQDEKQGPGRQKFHTAGPSVPCIFLLYFSMGYEALVASMVELNRTDSRFWNKVEYGKIGPTAMLGPERRMIDLAGITVHKAAGQRYFPPLDKPKAASEYMSVGCLNINSYMGGLMVCKEAASYEDGLIDLFRASDLVGTKIKSGFSTEKDKRVTFCIPPSLPGVHFQYDGESRYLFHPNAQCIEIEIKRVMKIPVVLGPENDELPVTVDEPGWRTIKDYAIPGAEAAFVPAKCLEKCKELCEFFGFGGFTVSGGKAYFTNENNYRVLSGKLAAKAGAVSYMRDATAQPPSLAFLDDSFRPMMDEWLAGNMTAKLNATEEEVQALHKRTDVYAQGICARASRAYVSFRNANSEARGVGDSYLFTYNTCVMCNKSCFNNGCKGCRRHFCKSCFEQHRGNTPMVRWIWENGQGMMSKLGLGGWSAEMCLTDAIKELTSKTEKRHVVTQKLVPGEPPTDENFDSPEEAAKYLKALAEEDHTRAKQPRSLKSFVAKQMEEDDSDEEGEVARCSTLPVVSEDREAEEDRVRKSSSSTPSGL